MNYASDEKRARDMRMPTAVWLLAGSCSKTSESQQS